MPSHLLASPGSNLIDACSFSPHSAVTNFIDEKLLLNTEEGQVDADKAAFKATTAEA